MTPYGEKHTLASRILADYIQISGFNAIYLGTDLPVREIIKAIRKQKVKLLALSVTMPENLENAKVLIKTIRESEDMIDCKIIMGGRAIEDQEINIGADRHLQSIKECLEAIKELSSGGNQ
jgi:methanogenic corrinoid protein MtbC1